MDAEIHNEVTEENLTDLVNQITSNGGKVTIEKKGDTYQVLASYPPIVEHVVLNNLRSVGGL